MIDLWILTGLWRPVVLKKINFYQLTFKQQSSLIPNCSFVLPTTCPGAVASRGQFSFSVFMWLHKFGLSARIFPMDKTTDISIKNDPTLEALFSVGAQYGFVKSRRHPSTKPFIFGVKNKIEIFDLEKTKKSLEKALEYIRDLASKKGSILFVGGKNEAKDAIEKCASSLGQPYVAGRWIGGALTNFPEIKKRVNKLETLLEEKEKGLLVKYTKKERLLIDRDIEKMKIHFTGLMAMKDIPKAMFVVDPKREHLAVKEAKDLGIPVVSISGSDCDLRESDFPIPANDSSKASITFFLEEIAKAYKEGLLRKE